NNTIINQGVGRDRVAKLTRTQIPTVRLADAPVPTSRTTRAERIEGSGSSLTLVRPRIPVEGKVTSVPPRDEIRREHGATVSSAHNQTVRTQTGLSQSATKSTTVSPTAPQKGTDPKAASTPSTPRSRGEPAVG